jgi:hypothetical protein
VRLRPQYGIPNDGKVDRSSRDGEGAIGCPKYYEAYVKAGMTGGLMALWCPHGICVGFHCIAQGEGRNDVFSALLTHWPTAPEVVIYDFACALAPYCMTREPEFFKRTRFLIDDFHQKGHVKCSKAAFLKTYGAYDPELSQLNSSAAESGNAGLRRIGKSVSYMTQARGIVFTKTYLSCWNRVKLLAMTNDA